MNKYTLFLVCLLLVSCNNEKTAFVDNEKLINDYEERKDIEAAYKNKIEAFGKRRDSLVKIFQQDAKEIEAKFKSMSKEKINEQIQIFQQKQQQLQQQLQREEQEIAKASQSTIDTLIKKVDDYILKYGKDKGYTYIFGKNKAGSVLYGCSSKNITDKVITLLNTEYKK